MADTESFAKPNTTNRPLSPHLQIYKPQITSVMSILHRITGGALAAGSILIAYWLWAAAYRPEAYECITKCSTASWFARAFLIAWSGAFYYHLLNGVRHLFWDAGSGFELGAVTRSGWIVLCGTAFLMAITWCPIFS